MAQSAKEMTAILSASAKMDKKKTDIETSHDRVEFKLGKGGKFLNLKVGGVKLFPIRAQALKGMCARLDVPYEMAKYADRHDYLKELLPILNAQNEKQGIRDLFVRTISGEVRHFASGQYMCIDNTYVAGAVSAWCKENDFNLHKSSYVSADDLVLHISTPKAGEVETIGKGDKHQSGFCVRNNEVGEQSMAVNGFVLRLVCTNGMVVPIEFNLAKRRHRGSRVLEMDEIHDQIVQAINSAGSMLGKIKSLHGLSCKWKSWQNPLVFAAKATNLAIFHAHAWAVLYAKEKEDSPYLLVQSLTNLASNHLKGEAAHEVMVKAGELVYNTFPWNVNRVASDALIRRYIPEEVLVELA